MESSARIFISTNVSAVLLLFLPFLYIFVFCHHFLLDCIVQFLTLLLFYCWSIVTAGPAWQSQGRCGEEDADYGKISSVCRKSCGICTPQYATKTALSAGIQAKVVVAVKPAAVAPQMSEKEAEYAKVDKMIHGAMTVDPNHLHTEYLKGNVPDRVRGDGVLVTSNDQCSVEKPDAQLLSRVALFNLEENESLHVDSQGNPLRIFCGIYTMQKNHNTNARATRNTWAKKCDGFIAFSTFEDPSIPSVDILHEGVEAYDNMWQKSRSIWKYIYTHLVDRYDFFLLGGDDMFYIVENLRHYLGSEEITKLKNEGDGKYYIYYLICKILIIAAFFIIYFHN